MSSCTLNLAVHADQAFVSIRLDTKGADFFVTCSVCTLDNFAEMVCALAFFLLVDNHHLKHSQQEFRVYEVLGLFDDVPNCHPKHFPQFQDVKHGRDGLAEVGKQY